MKKKMNRLLALVLAAVLLLGAVPATAQTVDGWVTGTFKFAPHTVVNMDLTDTFEYSDRFFNGSAYDADIKLAVMSMAMTAASISSQDAEIVNNYDQKNRNIIDLLEKIGFEDIESEYFKPSTDTMAVTVAHKEIFAQGELCTVLVVVPRSAGYEREWSGNFNVAGAENPDLHNGFSLAAETVRDAVEAYVAEYDALFADEMKLWTMGYSRGAATANLFGGLLHGEENYIPGLELEPEDTYVYTFGTPNNVMADSVYDPNDDFYGYIHNYFSEYDPITMMPLAQWGFTRFGEDHLLPTGDALKKAEMLALLQPLNPVVYDAYVGGQDPDLFRTVALMMANAVTDALPENTPDEEHAMKAFLEDRMEVLAKVAPSTEAYGARYQSMLCPFMELLFGMNPNENAAFMGYFAGSQKLRALVMVAEMFAAEYIAAYSDKTLLGVLTLGDVPLLVELMLAFSDGVDEQTQAAIMNTINGVIPDEVKDYVAQDAVDYLRGLAAENMAVLMAGAMETAAEANANTVIDSDLMARVLGEDNCNTLTMVEMFGAILFHVNYPEEVLPEEETDEDWDEEVEPVTDEEQSRPLYQQLAFDMAATAATALKNSGSYMRVHNNEILISWLRVCDPEREEEQIYVPSMGDFVSSLPGLAEEAADVLDRFRDLSQKWYRDGIRFCVEQGLMDGVSDTVFDPDGTMTRAMAVTVLWRMAGSPAPKANADFTDVEPGSWYSKAVAWAKADGIVNGVSETEFAPNAQVSRQQLTAMLWRYAGAPKAEGGLGSFADAAQVASYAAEAMAWAVEEGVINGMDGCLNGQANATRAQFAEMVRRLLQG